RLRRTGVGVEVAGLGISGGPALGFVVVEVEIVAGDDAAEGIAPVVGTSDIGALLADEDVVPPRLDAAVLVAGQERTPAPPGDRGHAAALLRNPGKIEDRRGDVDEAHKVLDDTPRRSSACGP